MDTSRIESETRLSTGMHKLPALETFLHPQVVYNRDAPCFGAASLLPGFTVDRSVKQLVKNNVRDCVLCSYHEFCFATLEAGHRICP